jgi:hypothetical protein
VKTFSLYGKSFSTEAFEFMNESCLNCIQKESNVKDKNMEKKRKKLDHADANSIR